LSEFNYITPVGLERIRRELDWLQKDERPRMTREVAYAASLGDRSENAEYIYGKKRLREIDRRMRHLLGRLERVQVIDPASLSGTKVRFGATIVVADEQGDEKRYRIYGEDEVDVDAGVLSWKSPIARALIGRNEGDTVRFEAPGGQREVEIVEVRYEPQAPLPPDEQPTLR
jgi:transcription elongation factor GreB